jgi:hypothetical protein
MFRLAINMLRCLFFSVPPDPIQQPTPATEDRTRHQSHYRLMIARRHKAKLAQQIQTLCENGFFDDQITQSEDERTTLAKCDNANAQCVAIDAAHSSSAPTPLTFLQQGVNAGYTLSTKFRRAIRN